MFSNLSKPKKKAPNKASKSNNLQELRYWKREFHKALSLIDSIKDGDSAEDMMETKLRIKHIEKKLDAAERNMYDISEGVYFGLGFELGNEATTEPVPIISKWSKLNNHVGFKGTTRVGKSVNMAGHIEQCIAKGVDVIVIDPKGGVSQEVLSSVTESCFRYKRAEDLMYISPAFLSLSERINVCYGLSNIELTGGIIESIKTPSMDSFYLETAEEILMAITSAFEYLQEVGDPTGKITQLLEKKELRKYHAFQKNKPKEEYEFLDHKDEIDMVEEFELNTEDNELLIEYEANGFNRTLMTFRELEAYAHHKSLRSLKVLVETIEIDKTVKYKKDVSALRRDALLLLKSTLSTEEAHFAKVSKTLTNRLSALSVGPIGELLCGIRINPLMNRLLRRDRGVIAVIQPFPMKFKNASMVLNKMLLGMLGAMMGSVGAEGRGLPRRVHLFMDEAGAIAFPGIENFFNRAGGLGVTVWCYTQTDEDYKEAVGDTLSNIIIDNVNTKGIMRQNLLYSQVATAEEIGTFKQMKTIAMVSAGSGSEGRYTTDVQEEYLCSPQDIKALPTGEGVFIHDGKRYYMEFPYRKPPSASIKMPELSAEKEKRLISDYEKILEENIEEVYK
ncbi:MAG: TraM recognition domain-containing protein [Sulfurimonas sp.]|nr:TraM recognition domain-containing protein [Sulfurimonas sp.]